MSTRPCRFFLQGTCRNGADCHFYHEGFSGISRNLLTGDSGMSFPTSVEHNDAMTTLEDHGKSDEDENEDNKCAICFEVPSTFGLLASCNHAFCLTCIRTWRSKDIEQDMRSSEQDRTSVTKACPNCRTQSLFVVPSSYFPSTPEQKEAIIQNYKVVSARRPCKYFKESGERHWCPFGDDCFFAHLDAQGERCKVNPQSNPRLNRRRDRSSFGGSGIGGSRSLFRRRAGFEGFGGYSTNYGGRGRYQSAARQRAHQEMMEDLAYIQMSTTNIAHNQLEQLQGLLVQLARLGVDDSNLTPNDRTQLRVFSEVLEDYAPGLRDIGPEVYYDGDVGDGEHDYDEDEDEDDYEDDEDFEDEDDDDDDEDDDDEEADSETSLERDEREAFEEFGDGLYSFQTIFQSTSPRAQATAVSSAVPDYDIDAYHDRVWAEYEGYY
ncbi:hypothetical protein BGZ96_007715 [Linnemannia gamsii]|uniref:RING-type E3 ubiquitin transferase n=1 Tax=Linnemannia gamsii TaxID=64522 RepID=A0ABQ7K0X4_9FUNG|nr:hypothetical protein BGZ96_007715 [Linnemannia gamsii]